MYRQIWLVLNTALPIFLFGVHFSVYYYFPNLTEGAQRSFLLRCLGILAVSGVVLSLVMYLGADFMAALFSSPQLAELFKIVSLYPLFTVPAMLLFHFLIADDRALRATIYNTGVLLIQAIIIVTLVARGMDLEKVFFILVFFAGGRLCFALFEIRRISHGKWGGTPGVSLGSHLKYAIPMGMTAMVAMVGTRLDKFVISTFFDSSSYGLYSVGALEFPVIILFSAAAGTVMRPQISMLHNQEKGEAISQLCRSVFRKLSLVLVPMAVFLAVFARELLTLLYTSGYADASSFFRIFLILTVFRIALFEPVLASVGMTRTVFVGGLGFLFVDLVLNLIAVKVFGMLGPPMATVVATALLAVFYGEHTRRYLRKGWLEILPVKAFARIVALSGIAAVAVFPLKILGWPPFAILLLGGIVFSMVYLGTSWITKSITRDDAGVILEWFRR